MSTRWTSLRTARMAAFSWATYASRRPKSVVRVMMGCTPVRRRRSAVAVDDEIGDEGQGLALLRVGKRLQITLGSHGVLVGAFDGVLHPGVIDHELAYLLDLGRAQRGAPQEQPDPLVLGGRGPLEHRDERQ